MVKCRVAIKSDKFSHLFRGDLATEYVLVPVHPKMCLVVDKIGSNISQRGDGHVRGKNIVVSVGHFHKIKHHIMIDTLPV